MGEQFTKRYLTELTKGRTKEQARKIAWETPAPLWDRAYVEEAIRMIPPGYSEVDLGENGRTSLQKAGEVLQTVTQTVTRVFRRGQQS